MCVCVCECVFVCECVCVCECVYRISFTNFGFFKYEPRYEFGHLKLRRCLGLRADGWLNERTSGQRGEEEEGALWRAGGRQRLQTAVLLLYRCLVCCWWCCCSQLLSLSTCFTPLWRRGVARSTEKQQQQQSWRQPQLCLGQRRTANDPFNGPVHKMPYQAALPCPALASPTQPSRLGSPWAAMGCLGSWLTIGPWSSN